MKLDRDVKITDHVQPVCLPDADQTYEVGTSFIVTGWGKVFGTYNMAMGVLIAKKNPG